MNIISTLSLHLTFRKDTPAYVTDFFYRGIKDERLPSVLYNYGFTFDNKPNFSGKTTMFCEENNGRFYLYIYHKFDFETEAAAGYWFSGGLAQYAEDDEPAGYLKHSDETIGVQLLAFRDKIPYWQSDIKIDVDTERYKKSDLRIRELEVYDYPFLEEFLYQAIYVPEESLPPDKAIIFQPELHCYIKNFGTDHDCGFVAEANNNPVGAIWTRLFTASEKGYGFVDHETPELSMSVDSEFRSNGIGTRLLEKMLAKLKESGYKQVSLSVDRRNFAYQMYQKFDFQEYQIDGNTAVMIKIL